MLRSLFLRRQLLAHANSAVFFYRLPPINFTCVKPLVPNSLHFARIYRRNMSTVKLEERREFARIINDFLRGSDLATVSLRSVRAHLQDVVGYDLAPVKDEIKSLITERFDEILAEQERDGNVKTEVKAERGGTVEALSTPESPAMSPNSSSKMAKTPSKRKHTLAEDARLAAKLHEELNAGRPSRSSTSAQKKKKVTTKKKTVKKSNTQADSDVSADEPEKKKRAINRNNPFNAPMQLSEALSELIGKTECSRPECVKGIWDYVKENGLQDPSDKRFIICDDSLKRVFDGEARVHMFTMNKILSNHIFPLSKKEETNSNST